MTKEQKENLKETVQHYLKYHEPHHSNIAVITRPEGFRCDVMYYRHMFTQDVLLDYEKQTIIISNRFVRVPEAYRMAVREYMEKEAAKEGISFYFRKDVLEVTVSRHVSENGEAPYIQKLLHSMEEQLERVIFVYLDDIMQLCGGHLLIIREDID